MTFALVVVPIALLLLGFPIFMVLLTAVTVALVFFMHVPLAALHQNLFASVNGFALLANLIFRPILMLFALVSPEGIQGLVQRLSGRQRWTLVRDTIPARPAVIKPFESAAVGIDPNQPLLQTRKLSKQFGNLVTARDIDLDIRPYVLHSIIGPN